MRREVGRPASRACTSWLVVQMRTSASQMLAMPCSIVPSTCTRTSPDLKAIGAMRFDLASEKKG